MHDTFSPVLPSVRYGMPFLISAANTRGNRLPATVTPAAVSRNSRRVNAGLASVMEMSSSALSHQRLWNLHKPRRGGRTYMVWDGSVVRDGSLRTSVRFGPLFETAIEAQLFSTQSAPAVTSAGSLTVV